MKRNQNARSGIFAGRWRKRDDAGTRPAGVKGSGTRIAAWPKAVAEIVKYLRTDEAQIAMFMPRAPLFVGAQY